ncbi:MAG: ABC transporter permease [Actinobacteria bacterium]|nr:ABC transporter permease [Actinomycetota bacterium]
MLGHLRGLRQRWTRTLLAVIAVGAGASLVVGVVIAQHSLNRSLGTFASQVTGAATLRIEGPYRHGGLDASVLPRVAAVPGVASAVPLVLTIAQVADGRGHESLIPAIGADCSAQSLVGAFDCTPEMLKSLGDNPILSPALQARLGKSGELRTDLQEVPTALAMTVDSLNQINGGRVAVFELSAAQRQFVRPDGFDQILIVAERGADPAALRAAVARAAGDHNNVVDANTPLSSSTVASLLLPFLFLFGIIGLVIGAQLVRNTLELSLEERRRELATAAALGATPRDVMTGLIAEGVVIGGLGGAASIVGGVFVAGAFVGSLSKELAKATGLHIPVSVSPFAIAVGAGIGLVVAVLASIGPARRAAKLDLVAELSDRARYDTVRAASNRRLVVTLVLAAAALVLGWFGHSGGSLASWQPVALTVALVVSAITAYVLCAQIAPRLLAALQRAPGFATGPVRVALANIAGTPRRTAALTVAITAPVYVAVVLGGLVPGISTAAATFANASTAGHVLVSTLEANNTASIDSKITPALAARLAAFPGVARLDRQYGVSSNGPELFSINAVEDAAPTYRVYRGLAGPEALRQGKVMLGPALARQKHLRPGDPITIRSRTGNATFVVGGVWASPGNVGYSLQMRADQMHEVGERPPDNIHLLPTPDTSPQELARALRSADLSPRLRIYDSDELGRVMADSFGDIFAPFRSLQIALTVVALIATASTLILAAAQRRRDNALLSALGMAPRALARATIVETALIALVAAITTGFTVQLLLVVFTWSSALVSGLQIPYRIDLPGVIAAAAIVTIIAIVGSTLPAWLTSRSNLIAALRST